MLHELAITDFAIIQAVRLRFTGGLIIFTGETGAGKSIVLDAIGAVLGERVGADVVRAGAQRAVVEAIFALPWLPEAIAALPTMDGEGEATTENEAEAHPDARGRLAALVREFGLEGDGDTLIITREIAATGRSTARVNSRAVPVNVLARLGTYLVDVHGQGAHLSLLHPDQHVNFLDRYAETVALREVLATKVRAWQTLSREIATLRRDERELERRAELLRYQVDEITTADLHPGELAELEQERTVLANAERLGETAVLAHSLLAGSDDGETNGALDLLNQVHRALSDLARIDGSVDPTLAAFDEQRYQLEDIAATVRDYRERVEANPARLQEVEERLDRITRLRRKYGATIDEILAYGEQAAAELEGIEHRDERIADLEAQIARGRVTLGHDAAALSAKRQAAAITMAAAMEAALARLNMSRARFFVGIEQRPDPHGVLDASGQSVAITPTGIDRVEYLIAPNPGEPPRPLARIASGGETARLMLALKTILAGADETPTLIFDEIDAGISGLTGQIVGEMLWQLARGHQVICVTHLPQMAAFGDQHWHVAKRIADDRTSTVVTEMDASARTLELAQMLGGIATESAARNAAELLDRADNWKIEQVTMTAATNGHSPNGTASPKKRARTK